MTSLRIRPPKGKHHAPILPASASDQGPKPSEPALAGTRPGRWRSSSKRTPCPLCRRDTDDKCRWSDGVIACHQGDTFSPPRGLQLGDVLELEGQRWAVVSFNGGFSGNALILRPHVDRQSFTPAQRRVERKVQAALLPTLQALFNRCRECVRLCLAMPELERCTVQQLEAELGHAQATLANLTALRGPLAKARREAPEMGRFVRAIDHWLRLVSHQLRDIELFLRVHLGTPTAEQIAALEAA